MTDEVQEGALPESESEELVAPEISGDEAEVQQPSVPQAGLTEDRLNELLDNRLASLTEALEKQAQSAKDRGISKNAQEIADLRVQVEAAGGGAEGWDALERTANVQATQEWQAGIEARISQLSAPTRQNWQEEWADESQKIVDAAKSLGVELTAVEYNSAMFNGGQPFDSKGDAFAALNKAIVQKTKGESIPVAAVTTEGGEVVQPPEPKVPLNYRQQLDKAKASGDDAEARRLLDSRWDEVEKEQAKIAAKASLDAAGVNPEDLIE